ncbi:MAG: CRISPR-associated endonuclease Cas2 [Anaerolineae bacterium]|nr:CRISPR-associated endonuclease Cas2 [Thermoflexales bacterium]MDW8407163.1 CRISPR-associated endonuclease Cas2 [Anaerolineae bacterium]
MMVVITYDVNTETEAGKKRLRRVAKECQNYGQRVQNSVFECLIDPTRFKVLRARLESLMDKQTDSLRYYFLGDDWHSRIEHVGAKPGLELDGVLMV